MMQSPRIILSSQLFQLTIDRLCYQLIENHNDFSESVLIGLQPRGTYLCKRIYQHLSAILGHKNIINGNLDVTFYRDDFRRRDSPLLPQSTEIDFLVEDKKVVLIDDVLFSGRTARAGLDALMDFGRPKKVEFLTLIDRRFSRQLPLQPDYTGKTVDAVASEIVKVEWKESEGEDKVILYTVEKNE